MVCFKTKVIQITVLSFVSRLNPKVQTLIVKYKNPPFIYYCEWK